MADETPEQQNEAQSPFLGSAKGLGVLKAGWDEPLNDEEFEELFEQPVTGFLDAALARTQHRVAIALASKHK